MKKRNHQMDVESLLISSGLKRTIPRIKVLEILNSRDAATSQPYLEKALGAEVDRVTLYRILQALEEKGIIHRILDSAGTANYGLCSTNCTIHAHQDEHLHFNCTNCLKVYCLDTVKIPKVQLPDGFNITTVSLVASGLCSSCAALGKN